MAGVSLKVLNPANTWVDAVNVSVVNDIGDWRQAKSVKSVDASGNWVIVWVPLSTVVVSGPTEALSQQSGSTGAAGSTIKPSTFTVTLGNYEPVAVVVLQSSSDAGATWTTVSTWNLPTTNVLTYEHVSPTAGNWLFRAAVTHLDSRLIYSNSHALTAYTKNLTAFTSNPSPTVFEWFTLSADCGAQCLPAPTSMVWLYRTATIPWTEYGTPTNPADVYQDTADTYEWMLGEWFADGSEIYSSSVSVTSTAIPHFHEVVPAGASAAAIQAAMDRASDWFNIYLTVPVNFADEQSMSCVELTPGPLSTDVYNIGSSELHYRRGVRLDGKGATLKGTGTHIFKGDNNGGGGYDSPNRDWQIINTIFDCSNTTGGLSTAHVFRYRLDGVTIKNIGGVKHNVEINSSGGPVEAGFNVEILNSTFFQETKSAGARAEDEAIQLDYSWDGAAPDVADDGTVTNNVVVRGCTFNNVPRAFGGHSYNSQPTWANGIHSHILFEHNLVMNVSPVIWGDAPNGEGSEGAVRVYYWNDVTIQNNLFQICYQPVMVYAPDNADGAAYDMGQTNILNNVYENCGGAAGRHAMFGSSGGTKTIGHVLAEGNQLIGTWGGGPDGYFAGFDNTSGSVPGYTQSAVIKGNVFKPDNFDLDGEVLYNKYRDANASNENGVLATGNLLSDGSEHNL